MCCPTPPVMAASDGTGTATGSEVVESMVGAAPNCHSAPFSPQQYTLPLPSNAQVVVSPTEMRRVVEAPTPEGSVELRQAATTPSARITVAQRQAFDLDFTFPSSGSTPQCRPLLSALARNKDQAAA